MPTKRAQVIETPRPAGRPVSRPPLPSPRPAAPAEVKTPPKREVKVQPLSKKDLEFFDQLLRAELERLASDLGKLESSVLKRTQRDASGDLSAYSIHMADLGTDAMEREKDLHFASAEGRRVSQVLEALNKVAQGTFGICDSCGGPIGRKRLEAVPQAAFCLSCQEKLERSS